MGFFSKLKEKFTEQVDKVQEKVSSVISQASEAIKFDKIKDGLQKTRKSFIDKFQGLLGVGRKIDDKLIDEIEEILITADIGVQTSEEIIAKLRQRVKKEGFEEAEDLYKILKEEIYEILLKSPSSHNDNLYDINESDKPHVIMVIGVNGAGKTTTIGKLAHNYKKAGKEVIIGAADTFRAAANEQLEVWAQRAGVDIVQQSHGADPGAVVFDTLKSAIANSKDVVIIDTAGRLHNKVNLMQELEKLSRVMKKLKNNAPNEVFLVLDATTGQNAIQQAKEFSKVAKITGIILTKLDGTAKGGVVIPIANELQIPVRFIGVGEKIDDLQVFDPSLFVEALFGLDDEDEDEVENAG
jgi:fused signal recognition particle receptor